MMRPAASGNKRALTVGSHDLSETGICIANINAAGRRRRTVMGVVVLAAWIAASVYFLRGGGRLAFALGLAPLFFAWLCLMQAMDMT
jgi:hypothetical protein